jgi:hypothetical protein
LDSIGFGKRKAVDREMREAESVAVPNCVFDESGASPCARRTVVLLPLRHAPRRLLHGIASAAPGLFGALTCRRYGRTIRQQQRRRRWAGNADAAATLTATATLCRAGCDTSGNFLIFSTMMGIKVLNLVTNRVLRVLGEVESSERFCHLVRRAVAFRAQKPVSREQEQQNQQNQQNQHHNPHPRPHPQPEHGVTLLL